MPDFEFNGKSVTVDEDGFIEEPDSWSEELAHALAKVEGVDELTDEHWNIVNYLRNYYQQFGIAPMVRKLCKETKTPLKRVYELFPSGPAKGACKVAGLPKPTGVSDRLAEVRSGSVLNLPYATKNAFVA